jgi:hypothetical protein
LYSPKCTATFRTYGTLFVYKNDITTLSVSETFFKRFIASGVYTESTRINYKIVPVTSLNKYLQYGISGTE